MKEPMQTSKIILIHLSLYPVNNEPRKWMRIVYRILPMLFVVVMLCAISACLSFVIKFKYINAEATIFTIMVALVYVGLIFIMAFAVLSRCGIIILFEQLTKIYRTSQYFIGQIWLKQLKIPKISFFPLKILAAHIDSNGILTRANDTCEWIWTIFFRIPPCLCFGLSAIFTSMYVIDVSNGNRDLNKFYRPYYSEWVWDGWIWKHPKRFRKFLFVI